MSRILVIDDDRDWLNFMARLLHQAGYSTMLATDARALDGAAAAKPDLIVTDIMMPGVSGIQVYDRLREQFGPTVPIVVCSSTRLKFKVEDPQLAYCTKLDAQQKLLPLVSSMLESTALLDSSSHTTDSATQRDID